MFSLSDWENREPIAQDEDKPWGMYYVFQDLTVSREHTLPENILSAVRSRFKHLVAEQPSLLDNPLLLNFISDDLTKLDNNLSADEKILVLQPKSPEYQVMSMQYHGRVGMAGHIEVWEFLTAGALVLGSETFKPYGWSQQEIEQEMTSLKVQKFAAGDVFVLLPGQWHALAKPSHLDVMVVREWRITPEPGRSSKDREENIVRTYDNAGRGILGAFPEEIMNQL